MPVASVGDTASVERTVTTDEIDRFAAVTGDENPLHTDEAYASATRFGGRVAHGMYTAGLVSAALASLPGDVIYLSQDLDFEAPVRPGDTVLATVEVVDALGGDRLRVTTTATVDGDPVLTGQATVLSEPHRE